MSLPAGCRTNARAHTRSSGSLTTTVHPQLHPFVCPTQHIVAQAQPPCLPFLVLNWRVIPILCTRTCVNSRTRSRPARGEISLRYELPICAAAKGSLPPL